MPKLLEQVRLLARLRHYSPRTEQTCVFWIRLLYLNQVKSPCTSSGCNSDAQEIVMRIDFESRRDFTEGGKGRPPVIAVRLEFDAQISLSASVIDII